MNTEKQQQAAAAAFAERWRGRGYERGESQTFWMELLAEVFGVKAPGTFIRFEERVKVGTTNFIDGHIPSTRVLIEQKSLGTALDKDLVQSDGARKTPFDQALDYVKGLPLSEHPRWIVTCNFAKFRVYDMEHRERPAEVVRLEDLGREYYRLQFLVDEGRERITREMQVSMQAGEIVGRIYDALLEQYADNSAEALRWLNILCVRLVFCLYAEDAGVFRRDQFHDYISRFDANGIRQALISLFEVLNTPTADRGRYLEEELKAFPYTNGGLFDEHIEIPQFTDALRTLLLERASSDFDWSEISPTIFGAVFESTLNPETRRAGGMHYTSIENIHKVIDPLFLNRLRRELDDILAETQERRRIRRLDDYREALARLTFLDPACGSGNFLTETYLSLRRLENEALRARYHGQMLMGEFHNPVRVSIRQFYGIELNDFAVTVATTALWISEAQMLAETERIVHQDIDFLPLKSYANIHEGNALQTDWRQVIPPEQLNYIIGNPPFVGFTYMDKSQKMDMQAIFPGVKNLDYVCAWYKKASDYIQGTRIECAFVSTNSIAQGETVGRFWPFLNIKIHFAHQTFRWDSEASLKAHVHCVIVGFAAFDTNEKFIYKDGKPVPAKNINAYLIDAPNVIVDSRMKSLCDVPQMVYGNKPADGGHLILDAAERDDYLRREPQGAPFVRPYIGAQEFINNKKRWCFWLVDVNPSDIRKCPLLMHRIEQCREVRANSIAAAIRKFAETPTLFAQRTQPPGKDYILVPRVSSERRFYVPMGFMTSETIVSDAVQIIPDATLYHFGVLTSSVHMAWMRAVCGRLEMRYRYSKDIVYNNFPWPDATAEQRAQIERTARAILDARAAHADASLADLYDELTMPKALRDAHRENDRAVMRAYGFDARHTTENQCTAALFRRYRELTGGQ